MKYKVLGEKIGSHVDKAQQAYGDSFGRSGDVVRVLLEPYRNSDGTYTIPDSLIDHLLVQVRIIDKQFRVFSNPDGDLMKESPYKDIAGYGLLGAAKSSRKEGDQMLEAVKADIVRLKKIERAAKRMISDMKRFVSFDPKKRCDCSVCELYGLLFDGNEVEWQ